MQRQNFARPDAINDVAVHSVATWRTQFLHKLPHSAFDGQEHYLSAENRSDVAVKLRGIPHAHTACTDPAFDCPTAVQVIFEHKDVIASAPVDVEKQCAGSSHSSELAPCCASADGQMTMILGFDWTSASRIRWECHARYLS
jgi:hypothetical protein